MNTRKPDYYDRFHCIADQCSLTCCQEWKIYVDDDTLKRWDGLTIPDDESGHDLSLTSTVTMREGERVIGLTPDHKCPFLNDQKLCRLVIAHGDSVLSETCTLFPRQIHEFDAVTEYSLAACCPAVVDEWNRGCTVTFVENSQQKNAGQENTETQRLKPSSQSDEQMDKLFQLRSQMITLMQNPHYTCTQSLSMIFYLLRDIYDCEEITEQALADFTNDRSLQKLSTAIARIPSESADSLAECNELFLDLAENYRKEGLYPTWLNPIAEKAEELAEDYDAPSLLPLLEQFHKDMAMHELLFQNYLTAEFFGSLLLPESDLENILVAFQWIGMEYAVLQQALFLRWILDGQTLTYETIRSYLCVIARMTGYDEADYYEYLENSFENLIWDWGYFALITPW